MEDNTRVPEHVAIILDGNGRWAKQHNLPRAMGHKAGCDTLEQTVRDADDLGIRYLTVYGFSTENWKRTQEEVSALIKLFKMYVKRLITMAKDNNVRSLAIGDRSAFDEELRVLLDQLETETKDNTGLTLTLALNYGSRDEIRRAVSGIAEDVKAGNLDPSAITEQLISDRLDTRGLPDPDLLIRTSGELRLSNYLLWQLAYSEIYITDTLWPDFNKEELRKAVEAYGKRERRFGGRK